MARSRRPSLILASGSPRRVALLSEAGFDFETLVPDVSEKADGQLTVRELTTWNALVKGLVVARAHPDNVVLAADTLVAWQGEVLGKPADMKDAVRMLHKLSGKTHEVYSGVFIGHMGRGRLSIFQEVSQVRFKQLDRAAIGRYFAKIDPLDKAGAYAAQGHGQEIIAEIRGSYTNVVGLPMEQTIAALAEFGIRQQRP
jgi:septum formation protein